MTGYENSNYYFMALDFSTMELNEEPWRIQINTFPSLSVFFLSNSVPGNWKRKAKEKKAKISLGNCVVENYVIKSKGLDDEIMPIQGSHINLQGNSNLLMANAVKVFDAEQVLSGCGSN